MVAVEPRQVKNEETIMRHSTVGNQDNGETIMNHSTVVKRIPKMPLINVIHIFGTM